MHPASLRVLNLEADRIDHERVRRHAAAAGLPLQFELATNREEFERALAQGRFDLVLADHTVPGFDGLDALAAVQRLQPGTPYLIVSHSVGEDRAAAALRAGARDFVHKDRLEGLPAALRAALSSRRQAVAGPEAEERFREMAENIREVFWDCAADTRAVLYVSPAYAEIWGQPPAELLAAGGTWPPAVAPEDLAAVTAALARGAIGQAAEVEYRIKAPGGTTRWIHDRVFPVPALDGRPARLVGAAQDITERRRLEGELLQSQKMELVGKLAGGIAHDFNNLLTIISGYVSLLLDNPDLPAVSLEALRRVFTASCQASNLVRQLSIFSRKRAPRLEVIDLNQEVETMASMLQRLLGETVTVNFVRCPEPLRVNADTGMLEQLLTNLAVNGRDAMGRGGRLTIALELRPADSPPPPSPAPDGRYVCLSVRDTGTGIAPTVLPRIFEPFFTTKTEGYGTGLGLATVRDIVRRHEGWIEVDTAVGTGTTFRVYLPRTSAALPPAAAPAAVPGGRRAKGTILLVEDEANVREFAAAVLQLDGFSVLQTGSADAALETWQWHAARVDLLLTDVVLPGELSGLDLAAALRELKPTLRIVLTTGYGREVLGTAEAPPLPVLSKPYTPRSLMQAVTEALR